MQEDRAAAPGHPRAGIVVDLDDQVVKPVAAPEAVAWFIDRPSEGAVVAAVGRILAPGQVHPDPPDRQPRRWPRSPIRALPQAQRPETPGRGRPIAFPLVGPDAGAPQYHRD